VSTTRPARRISVVHAALTDTLGRDSRHPNLTQVEPQDTIAAPQRQEAHLDLADAQLQSPYARPEATDAQLQGAYARLQARDRPLAATSLAWPQVL
jgi:hypothetical protein